MPQIKINVTAAQHKKIKVACAESVQHMSDLGRALLLSWVDTGKARDHELVLLEHIIQTIEAGVVASSNLGDSYTVTIAAEHVTEWRRLAGLEAE